MYFNQLKMMDNNKNEFIFKVGFKPTMNDKPVAMYVEGYKVLSVNKIYLKNDEIIINVKTAWGHDKNLKYTIAEFSKCEISMNKDGLFINVVIEDAVIIDREKSKESLSVNKEMLGKTIDENHNFHKLTQQFEMLTGKKFDDNLMKEIARQGDGVFSPLKLIKEQSEKGLESVSEIETQKDSWNMTEKHNLDLIKGIFKFCNGFAEDIINATKK